MRVLHVSKDNFSGGAGIAAERLLQAQLSNGIEARMLVDRKFESSPHLLSPTISPKRLIRLFASPLVDEVLPRLQQSSNKTLHSAGLTSTLSVREINDSDTDIVNLHWINSGMLSIRTIPRIKKPLVWTLHDMWAFSGAEHYAFESERYLTGYTRLNKSTPKKGIDIDRMAWALKKLSWRDPIQIVTPSTWLEGEVRRSNLMQSWPVTTIPNPIDTKFWKRENPRISRELLGLPLEVPLILFGAVGGTNDFRKGYDLLKESINKIKAAIPSAEFVVFGQGNPGNSENLNTNIHYLGRLNDELTLKLAYSAADVFVIPSRQDNLPNTAIEAQCCGLPVVAFNTSGLSDVVDHGTTGYLARPFDTDDFSHGIITCYQQSLFEQIGKESRARAEQKFASEGVAQRYFSLYKTVLSEKQKL